MLCWGGNDHPMKMGAIPRAVDKKPRVNNNQKTAIIKRLAKIMEVPCAIADCTALTSAGFVGRIF